MQESIDRLTCAVPIGTLDPTDAILHLYLAQGIPRGEDANTTYVVYH